MIGNLVDENDVEGKKVCSCGKPAEDFRTHKYAKGKVLCRCIDCRKIYSEKLDDLSFFIRQTQRKFDSYTDHALSYEEFILILEEFEKKARPLMNDCCFKKEQKIS
jgi:hypothetical protein